LFIVSLQKKPKREATGEVDEKGRKIYRDAPNRHEFWLQSYEIMTEDDLNDNI